MSQKIKKYLFYLIILAVIFFTPPKVSANVIENINIDVYINPNGDAAITEVWDTNLYTGTEGYRTYKNLGNSEISNFSVSDNTGAIYQYLDKWSTSATFENKAYKNGIHYINNGLELCWGISDYNIEQYILKYNISNFVTQYTDNQGIYFNFLDLDQAVNNAKITIRSYLPLSKDNTRIWAFGNNGSINWSNGSIVYESGGKLEKSQYMVGLIRMQSNIFTTNNTSDKSFDNIYEEATKDSDYQKKYNSKEEDDEETISTLLMLILSPLLIMFNPLIWIAVIVYFITKNPSSRTINKGLDFGPNGKILPSEKEINYWREIPCNKELSRAYWVASQYELVSKDKLKEGIIGAMLLKWIKEGLITVTKTKKGLFSFKDNNYAIDFSNMHGTNTIAENRLFEVLKEASGHNYILEAKEFEKWCKKNYSRFESLVYRIEWVAQAELEKQNLITTEEGTTTNSKNKQVPYKVKHVSPQLREDAIQLMGLKKFLLDFSTMPDRQYFEVHLWEEYLIFAQLLGIADKVEEQFSKLYPNFNEVSKLNTDLTTIAIRNMVYRGYQESSEASRRAAARASRDYDYSGSSSSSGGGGSSSSGGGSSSGGSSGGGFR